MTTIPGMPAQLARAQAGDDPRGWLVFDAPLPEPWQLAEDSTAVADRDRCWLTNPRPYDRPATTAEIQLLQHLGYEVPDDLMTTVCGHPRPSDAAAGLHWKIRR